MFLTPFLEFRSQCQMGYDKIGVSLAEVKEDQLPNHAKDDYMKSDNRAYPRRLKPKCRQGSREVAEEYANMFKIPKWRYDEMKQSGVDYLSIEQVHRYDDRHQRFRDYEKDSDAIIKLLELDSKSTVIDMGAGTGAFALHAAKHCQKIYGAIASANPSR